MPVEAPSLGRRLLRGWLWGMLYGQWWTLWFVISSFLWRMDQATSPGMIVVTIVYAIVNGFFGSLAGLVIGALNADETAGAGIGIGAGMLIMLLEVVVFRSAFQLVNIFFYFFTGRYVGSGIAGRVQRPVVL